MTLDTAYMITAFVTLLVVIDPVAIAPIFLAVTQTAFPHCFACCAGWLPYSDDLCIFWKRGAGIHRDIPSGISRVGWYPVVPNSDGHVV